MTTRFRFKRSALSAAVICSTLLGGPVWAQPPIPSCTCPEDCQPPVALLGGDAAAIAVTLSDETVVGDETQQLSPSQIDATSQRLQSAIRRIVGENDLIRIQLVRGQGLVVVVRLQSARNVLRNLQGQLPQLAPQVIIEPDYRYSKFAPPDDPWFHKQWPLENVGASLCINDADVNFPEALDELAAVTGSSVPVVAVLEEGISLHHDLVEGMWTNATPDDSDGDGYKDDVHGWDGLLGEGVDSADLSDPTVSVPHGTMVTSIIGAVVNNKSALAGMTKPKSVVLCRYFGASSELIACLRYVRRLRQRGVPVVAVNLSWGGTRCSCGVDEEIRKMQEDDLLLIASAGNDAMNNDYPGSGPNCPVFPASQGLPNIVSVAASTCGDDLWAQSNYGTRSVHVVAPGSLVPAISSMTAWTHFNFQGTSAAAPHATGLAALLKLQNPDRDWKAIRNLLISGGTPGAPGAASTISGRRLRAAATDGTGSLSCKNQTVQRRLLPVSDGPLNLKVNADEITLAVLSINCAVPEGGLTRTVNLVDSGGTVVSSLGLKDDGVPPDLAAEDGIYTGSFKPTVTGTYKLQFWGDDSDALTVDVS